MSGKHVFAGKKCHVTEIECGSPSVTLPAFDATFVETIMVSGTADEWGSVEAVVLLDTLELTSVPLYRIKFLENPFASE